VLWNVYFNTKTRKPQFAISEGSDANKTQTTVFIKEYIGRDYFSPEEFMPR
jgi:hypothetical protein